MTVVWFPERVNAAHDVRPIGGVMCTPPEVTLRSVRGALTLNTPAFSSSLPFAPVSCSMRAWSSCGPAFGAPRATVEGSKPASAVHNAKTRIGHLRSNR